MLLQYLYARGDSYKFSGIDIFYPLFLVVIIFYFAKSIRDRKIEENPSYKYYLAGLLVKIVGGIMVVLVYSFYYTGGDTVYFFFDSMTLTNLLFKNPAHFFDVVVNGFTIEKFSYLDSTTGTFVYYRSPESFFCSADNLAIYSVRIAVNDCNCNFVGSGFFWWSMADVSGVY
ncbi:MAG: hypothetical protein UZ10_BCD003001203 [Bacteroidetes bacterium OLB10]|nr:MAG: hypothetical protein UZ10_BCD003001203 [Bacteroidetes bacterium OLB10]